MTDTGTFFIGFINGFSLGVFMLALIKLGIRLH